MHTCALGTREYNRHCKAVFRFCRVVKVDCASEWSRMVGVSNLKRVVLKFEVALTSERVNMNLNLSFSTGRFTSSWTQLNAALPIQHMSHRRLVQSNTTLEATLLQDSLPTIHRASQACRESHRRRDLKSDCSADQLSRQSFIRMMISGQ